MQDGLGLHLVKSHLGMISLGYGEHVEVLDLQVLRRFADGGAADSSCRVCNPLLARNEYRRIGGLEIVTCTHRD